VQFLTDILPEEFRVRNMNMPFAFTNIAEWSTKGAEKYGVVNPSLPDLAAYSWAHSAISGSSESMTPS
jgi:hypothetical protein